MIANLETWSGPLKVIDKGTDAIFRIQLLEDSQAPILKVHINQGSVQVFTQGPIFVNFILILVNLLLFL